MDLSVTPAIFHILLSLSDSPRHGYAIMKEVDERTGGEVRLGPGTLYRSLQKMVDRGLVEEEGTPSVASGHDTRRRCYRLTPPGRRLARSEAERLRRLLGMAEAKQLLTKEETAR